MRWLRVFFSWGRGRQHTHLPPPEASPTSILVGMVSTRLIKDLPKPRVRYPGVGHRYPPTCVQVGGVELTFISDSNGCLTYRHALAHEGKKLVLSTKDKHELGRACDTYMRLLREREQLRAKTGSEHLALNILADAMGVEA